MIRHILIFLAIFLFVTHVYSQPKGVKYNIGPKIGVNLYKSRFNFKEDEKWFDQKTRIGFQLGATLDMPLKEMIHFVGEFYYSHKGKKTLITDSGLTNDARYQFLELPVLLRFSFNGGKVSSGDFKWHLDLGPSISYWLSGKGSLYGNGPTSEYEIIFSETPPNVSDFNKMYISNVNRFQWGLIAGVGINYPIYRHQVVYVDLRIGFGGTNLGQHDTVANLNIIGFAESMSARFLEFSLSAAYTFEVDWIQTKRGKSTVTKRKKS